MDFLGLRNLTVIDDAVKTIRKREPDFDISKIPDDDEATYNMLSSGSTAGVFQMESTGITAVCTGMQPHSIEDITAIIALYRPGPMDSIPRFIRSKHNPDEITYKHPLSAHTGGHLRVHRVSGAGHRHFPQAGGLLPRAGRYDKARHVKEKAGGDRKGEEGLHLRRSGAEHPRRCPKRHPGGYGGQHIR